MLIKNIFLIVLSLLTLLGINTIQKQQVQIKEASIYEIANNKGLFIEKIEYPNKIKKLELKNSCDIFLIDFEEKETEAILKYLQEIENITESC